ncbi:lysM domain receptor-like kinase 4 [Vigna unguiculata]|uniref:Chitin elicitor receptor kinase 1 n=1 Tax=Vigna unguiculata TaxID=3917 RepID=A0A4D6LHQ6_VIGUN|nr:lysM domain receptor-like kinase 4 [Vigna unguiculata]QCD88169.1 chitin elicitor receptor kinase 1 [Vigna unguiculata]
MGNLVLVHKIMLHLWFAAWICLGVCSAYNQNNCTSNEIGLGTRYSCKSTHDSCETFVVYRANKNFNTISSVSKLFNKSSDEVLLKNNLVSSSLSLVLKQGKEVLIPVNCTCSGTYYQTRLSYKVIDNTTFSEVACGVFEGLLSRLTLAEENLSQGNEPEAGSELHVPLICVCPNSENSTWSKKVKYLVTYPLIANDDPDKVSEKFQISPQEFYAVNKLNSMSTVYPNTVVLVPLEDGPIRILDIPDSPSPPPGFLPTNPVDKTQQYTKPSHLYIAGSVIGFLLLITLLASGFYIKRLRKIDVVHSLSTTNSLTLWSPTRSSQISTQTGKSNTTWCLSPDLLVGIKYYLLNYTIEEIQKGTKNFSQENNISRGGDFVYKGRVNDVEVMVKRMRLEDTQKVIDLHSKINHINIVNLLGVCYGESNDSWSYLVFELPKNGCLRECLSDRCNALNWYKRTQIAFDIATCLYYLHCCSFPSYAHMNVSSRNIFITADCRGKLADVGRALAASATLRKSNDTVEIPKGLVAPEFLSHGSVSEKVDIFAFGVVLLELISGRDNFDGKKMKDSMGFLLGEASEGGCFEGLRSFMDPNLKDYSLPEALCLSFLAKDCVADDPLRRPSMDDIMKVLAKMV